MEKFKHERKAKKPADAADTHELQSYESGAKPLLVFALIFGLLLLYGYYS